MYKIYFKQAVQLLRQNPFISIISILGTALAIMMIMVIIVANNIHNISVKPEVNRDRSFYIYTYYRQDPARRITRGTALNYSYVQEYFYTLQTPEVVTAFEFNHMQKYRQSVVQREGSREFHKINMRFVDNAFWRVFSFDFVQGAPFTQEEFESGIRKAVISKTMAHRLFKGENPVGLNIQIDNIPYSVCGVVKDVSPVFKMAFGDVWAPYTSKQGHDHNREVGQYLVIMLAKNPKNDHWLIAEEINEMERKYSASRPAEIISFGIPWEHARFDGAKAYTTRYGSYGGINNFQSFYRAMMWNKQLDQVRTALLFLLLLLVPAMNLSGFSVSRMKKRTEEIGIRKAFGAKTGTILFQVIYENIITSFIGGILGLMLSYAAVLLMRSWILGVDAGASIPIATLVSPAIFLLVVLLCVLLSIISSGIPAIRAARMNIVKSISKNDR